MSTSSQNRCIAQDDVESKELEPLSPEGHLVRLVSNGDAILVLSDNFKKVGKRFSVSTTILGLASTYFDRLFHGCMAEAQELSKKGSVSIALDDDDPQAVEVILRVLHHQAPDASIMLDLYSVSKIAWHSDKYDTCAVLEPWIGLWLDALPPIGSSPIDVGLFLLATQMVRAKSRFALASSMAVRELAIGFERSWSAHELLQHVPNMTICKRMTCNPINDLTLTQSDHLTERIYNITQESKRLIEGVEATLRENNTIYGTKYMQCHLCARRHPSSAKKCHPCSNTDLHCFYCTSELRVSDYMEVLRKAELWGSSAPLESLSASEIQSRMSCVRVEMKHSCDAGLNCPLRLQMGVVVDNLQRLLHECGSLSFEDLVQRGVVVEKTT